MNLNQFYHGDPWEPLSYIGAYWYIFPKLLLHSDPTFYASYTFKIINGYLQDQPNQRFNFSYINPNLTSGLYYKGCTIVIYIRNHSTIPGPIL